VELSTRQILREEEVDDDRDNDGEETYTVEDAVEKLGLGWFQFRLWAITGLFSVRI
jgi:hypothetical protein